MRLIKLILLKCFNAVNNGTFYRIFLQYQFFNCSDSCVNDVIFFKYIKIKSGFGTLLKNQLINCRERI